MRVNPGGKRHGNICCDKVSKDEPLKGMTMNASHVALPKRSHWAISFKSCHLKEASTNK